MREIKFRYTCKRENGHTFFRIFTLEQIESGEVRQWWELNFIGKDGELHKDQYIGLLDKNGKEIYEGDLLNGLHHNYPVTYFSAEARFEATLKECYIPTCDWYRYEVIGNIYENEDLLK